MESAAATQALPRDLGHLPVELSPSGARSTAAGAQAPFGGDHPTPDSLPPRGPRGGAPLPLRPRGGFGGYLHELRRERGLTIRQVAAAAGVHHTYVSKLERGDRQAPEEAVVEALAGAVGATPAQLDQLRWRAGLAPRGTGAPGQDDPTLTLVAEALGDPALSDRERDLLRQGIVQAARLAAGLDYGGAGPPAPSFGSLNGLGAFGSPSGTTRPSGATGYRTGIGPDPSAFPSPTAMAPEAPLDGRPALLAGLLGGWQTLDEAAAELRVMPAYLWELVQSGQLKAWALPGAPAGSPAGIRLRREDVLALLQPVQLLQPYQPAARR